MANDVERIADLDRIRAREVERLQSMAGICGSLSRCAFAAAACFCLWQGRPGFAIGFMVLSFTGGISVSVGGGRCRT